MLNYNVHYYFLETMDTKWPTFVFDECALDIFNALKTWSTFYNTRSLCLKDFVNQYKQDKRI